MEMQINLNCKLICPTEKLQAEMLVNKGFKGNYCMTANLFSCSMKQPLLNN